MSNSKRQHSSLSSSSLFSLFFIFSLFLNAALSNHLPFPIDGEGSEGQSGVQEKQNESLSQSLNQDEEIPTLRPHGTNPFPRFRSFNAQCDKNEIKILVQFDSTFHGRIYANNYPDDKSCGFLATNNTLDNVNFSLPLEQCGVQMVTPLDDNLGTTDLQHDLVLYIQYSAFVQQVVDEKVAVSCMEVRVPLEDTPSQEPESLIPKRNSRQGRRLRGKSIRTQATPKTASQIGEALMEIISGKDPSPKSKKIVPVFVGEDVTLVISTRVIRGYDARIVNCTVHDGSRTTTDGSRVQQILDSAGCSIDRGLVPNFRRRRLPIESKNRLITLHFASFPAFKFPERDHIHMKCSVAFCEGPCPQESCENGINHYGSWKEKYGGRIGNALVDTIEVANSLQVLAPSLDDVGGHHYERHQSSLAFGSATAADVAPSSSLSSSTSSTTILSTPSSSSPSISLDQIYRQHKQFSDTAATPKSSSSQPQQRNPYYQHSPSMAALSSAAAPSSSAAASGRSINNPNNNNNFYYNNNDQADVQALYNNYKMNNQLPQMMTNHHPNLSTVCISPGTIIIILVILGVVLVISASATLWFALRRSEAKKYAAQRRAMSSYASSGGSASPSPYYRFSHW